MAGQVVLDQCRLPQCPRLVPPGSFSDEVDRPDMPTTG